jgi:hypothetical protein
MLGITANWGLTDGSLGGTPPAQACRWLDAVRLAAIRAGRCRDGRYRAIEQVRLVFAGDTLNLLLSDRWAGNDRPWHGGCRGRTARLEVVAATLREARIPLGTLRRWTRDGLGVPVANGHGCPTGQCLSRAAVEVVVLLGDHDAGLGELSTLGARLGIQIGGVWSDGVHEVRHGHELDPVWSPASGWGELPGAEIQPTLGESLVVDLLVPFAVGLRERPAVWRIARPFVGRLSAAGPDAFPALISPLLLGLPPAERSTIADGWRTAVDRWFTATLRDPPASDVEFDLPAALAPWLASAVGRRLPGDGLPPVIRQLEMARPQSSPGFSVVLGHLAGPSVDCGSVVGLGDEPPRLLVQPRIGAAVECTWLGSPPPNSGIVSVGTASAGGRLVDAA